MRRAGPHISLAEPRYLHGGSALFFKPSQKFCGVGEMYELGLGLASGEARWRRTLSISARPLSCSGSRSLPLVSDLRRKKEERGAEGRRLWRQGYPEPSRRLTEATTSNRNELGRTPPPLLSSLLISRPSLCWGSSCTATHLSSAGLRRRSLTGLYVNTGRCVGFMTSPLPKPQRGPASNPPQLQHNQMRAQL